MCRVDYGSEEGAWITEPHIAVSVDALRCCECGRDIDPGEPHTSFEWTQETDDNGEPVPDATVGVNQFCTHCAAAAMWLDKVCSGHLYGDDQINEDLMEHWYEESPPIRSLNLGRLVVGMRRKWLTHTNTQIPVDTVKAWAVAGAEQAMAEVS